MRSLSGIGLGINLTCEIINLKINPLLKTCRTQHRHRRRHVTPLDRVLNLIWYLFIHVTESLGFIASTSGHVAMCFRCVLHTWCVAGFGGWVDVPLECWSGMRTRNIHSPTNQRGDDAFETAVGKVSARSIQIRVVYVCTGILLKVILNCFQNNAPTKIDQSDSDSPRRRL